MLGRTGRQDFVGVIGRALEEDGGHHPFKWHVYESYELIGEVDRQHAYFRAPNGADSLRKTYEPLTDTPHLFLEFARLAEHEDREQAIRDWIAEYGLLGLHPGDASAPEGRPSNGTPYFRSRDHLPKWLLAAVPEYDARGGPGEALTLVEREVGEANRALIYWEAALSGDLDRLEQTIFGYRHRDTIPAGMKLHAAYGDEMRGLGVFGACLVVQEALEAFTYPFLAFDPIAFRRDPGGDGSVTRVSRSWRPRNLLGAMYLQMYWLMTSSGEVVRCEYCGRILPLTRPHPESRKPRNDKKYCNRACLQAHWREKKRHATEL